MTGCGADLDTYLLSSFRLPDGCERLSRRADAGEDGIALHVDLPASARGETPAHPHLHPHPHPRALFGPSSRHRSNTPPPSLTVAPIARTMDEERVATSDEARLSLRKALQQCELVQNMIDISISSLEGLRTKCATSNDLTQKEIRTLEVRDTDTDTVTKP